MAGGGLLLGATKRKLVEMIFDISTPHCPIFSFSHEPSVGLLLYEKS